MDDYLVVLGALVLGIVTGRLTTSNANRAFKYLAYKVDAIIEHTGIDFKPYQNMPKEVLSALDGGERVKEIKLYRCFSRRRFKRGG